MPMMRYAIYVMRHAPGVRACSACVRLHVRRATRVTAFLARFVIYAIFCCLLPYF